MLSSQTDQTPNAASQAAVRSPDSLAFERIWTAAKGDRLVPSRDAIDLRTFAKFAHRMAIIEPNPSALLLPFRLVGSAFFDYFGFDLTGMDYLDFVDPAIKESAHACVMACLKRPCGLWQRTPAQIENGGPVQFEYTILPVAKDGTNPDLIIVLVMRDRPSEGERPSVKRIEHSTVWQWIDLGFGAPDAAAADRPF
jgi:hypothetical protein